MRAAASMALKMWPSSCIDTRRPNLSHECRQGAAMALFLASDSGSRISGQVMVIDGHTENPDPKV